MGAKPLDAAQIFGGCILLIMGTIGILEARFALLHHTVVWWTRQNNTTWVDPWLATVGFGILLLLGIFLLVDAIRRRR
jgi:putative Mn2+ efflux pump MntP